MQRTGIIHCPYCQHRATEPMPEYACLRYFTCPGCQTRLKPRDGDCCVFCSYGDTPCPPRANAQAHPRA